MEGNSRTVYQNEDCITTNFRDSIKRKKEQKRVENLEAIELEVLSTKLGQYGYEPELTAYESIEDLVVREGEQIINHLLGIIEANGNEFIESF